MVRTSDSGHQAKDALWFGSEEKTLCYWSNENTLFQSFFMLITVQPSFLASS
jgi:hypothetical protein